MARARNLKPGYFQNEDLADCGIYAHLLFSGLWTIADRSGRLEDRPRRIKVQLMPFYDVDVDKQLASLESNGFITRYEHEGKKYIQIINFEKHQNPHIKENASTIPAPVLNGAKPGKSGTGPADSLLPLTDSLNPIQLPCQATPDAAGLQNKNGNNYKHEALEVLEFLNETTGRKYRPVDATLKPIICRLRSGVTVQDCRTMIVRKWRDWHQDEKMEKYLRPATLFRASNFENYLAECVAK